MRALCTVRGPLAAGAGGSLAPAARLVAVRAPGATQPLHFVLEAKARARDLKALADDHFHLRTTGDAHLFGLAILNNGEYLFVDLDSKLSKYAPKSWRSSHTHGLDANGRPLLELHLAVQFYVESPLLIDSEAARRLYCLQLRGNMLAREPPPAERALLLAGLALQADRGDADPAADRDYFALRDYAPASLTGDWVAAAVRACHRDNRGLSPARAHARLIRELALLPDSIDSHKYRMKRTKMEPEPGGARLLVTARGISVVPDDGPAAAYVWSAIGKLSFDRKKFEIRTQDGKVTLYSSNDDKSKYLFALCRETHQFSMKMAPRLAEVLQKEEEERKCCYGYSNLSDFHCSKTKSEQRVSVISSVSSNTTSGIVSDRVQSEDELEIMIDCPPALSTESLAFAHLLDSSGGYFLGECSKDKPRLNKTVSLQCTRTRSDEGPSDTKESSDKGSEKDSPAEVEQAGDSPVSGKLKCAGSQCSSSCSTVVVARAGAGFAVRRASDASSLELGFSHTAQNSMLSDNSTSARDADYIRDTASALYDGIGPVTVAASSETSGVYTMGSSETTAHTSKVDTVSDASRTECGSSHYGSYRMNDDLTRFDSVSSIIDSVIEERKSPTEESLMFRLKNERGASDADCVDGGKMFLCDDKESFRQRVGSDTSAASFHGDGSDPTDGKHALLSASELSDLIVGRGVYPKRQSVSDTLDSVSDYVRLPLPLSGESYLHGHEDTAPSEDYLGHDAFFERPPTPPARLDSRKLNLSLPNIVDLDELSTTGPAFPAKPPPPYEFDHKTFSPEGPSRHFSKPDPLGLNRNPPPYPSKVSLERLRYENEEVAARVVTSKPMITILKAEAGDVSAPIERTFAGPMSIEHRFQKSKRPASTSRRAEISRLAHEVSFQRDSSSLVAMMKLPPPPPPRTARLPPPPPPPHLQQFHQQLYSDVDYVFYPWQDPLVSQQNYLESKLANRHSGGLQYRSTPFLSTGLAGGSVYGSTQNLSDSYVQLPYGLHAAPASHPERPPRPAPRTRSHDDLLESPPRLRRLPPPPPPPYEHRRKLPGHSRDASASPPRPAEDARRDCAIDIKTLREKSKNLDLPLIAALCNDRSLLKQTRAFGAPKPSRRDDGDAGRKPPGATTDSLNFRCNQDFIGKTSQVTQGKKLLVRNPNDKLPDIPRTELHTPRALCNTYVAPPGNKQPRT